MKQIATLTAAVLLAFGAGFAAAHLGTPAAAATMPLTPQFNNAWLLSASLGF